MTNPGSPVLRADLETQIQALALEVVRNHEGLCVGVFVADEPYCSCAPDNHPRCASCAMLVSAIATFGRAVAVLVADTYEDRIYAAGLKEAGARATAEIARQQQAARDAPYMQHHSHCELAANIDYKDGESRAWSKLQGKYLGHQTPEGGWEREAVCTCGLTAALRAAAPETGRCICEDVDGMARYSVDCANEYHAKRARAHVIKAAAPETPTGEPT